MLEADPVPDRPAYAALGMPLFPDASVQDAVSDGTWTYARNRSPGEDGADYLARAREPGAEFLFDRRVDSGENVNLVEIESAEAERLRDALGAHVGGGSRALVEEGVRIDPAIADRLRAMGYLQ